MAAVPENFRASVKTYNRIRSDHQYLCRSGYVPGVFMLWKGNNSPQNIGLTIVGYLYRQGIEKRAMGYACAVGLVLLVVVMIINMIQLVATGTFKKEER